MSQQTFLLVDDSRLSRTILKSMVKTQKPDWEIIEAVSGEEALEKIVGRDISCMSVDYNMPGMDGITLAEKLRAQYPNGKIALLTANIQDSIKEQAEQLGIEFIQKPISEEKVQAFLGS